MSGKRGFRRDSAVKVSEYRTMLGLFRSEAKAAGYAIAEHGSKKRDIDLIAVPWTSRAISAKGLVKKLCAVRPLRYFQTNTSNKPIIKPHGRLGCIIYCPGSYIDLSIMPRIDRESTGDCS